VAQQGAADPSRAPAGRQVLWAYAHVPHGCDDPRAGERVLRQLERFAPGVRDRIRERVDTSPAGLEAWNANLVGGDIGGGSLDGLQQLFRPAVQADPYATGVPGVWLCSSSTPPGGGVHGMAGYHAARRALRGLARSRRPAG
jgi:phytoene dehydrogenase-like protein